MDGRVLEHAALEAAVRWAIEAGKIKSYFQPVVHLEHGRVAGFKMLARWDHPVRGAIPPGTFIPIAEDTGLIVPLTERLLTSACRIAVGWPERLTLSVNISPVHLHDPRLPELVAGVLGESGLPPSRLKIEVTESAVIRNFDLAKSTVEALREVGVRLSLDDFGTGYSSLRHLQLLPFDEIKIDASFVQSSSERADSRKIVAAIVGLGHSLGLPIIAEGVETEEQAAMPTDMGCDLAQGWLHGRAIPAEAVRRMLELSRIDWPPASEAVLAGGPETTLPAALSASGAVPPPGR